jgi:hypothetical protein
MGYEKEDPRLFFISVRTLVRLQPKRDTTSYQEAGSKRRAGELAIRELLDVVLGERAHDDERSRAM